MSMKEKIRVLMAKRDGMAEAELARRIGNTPQNFNNKMKRDNFCVRDLEAIANAMGCTLDISFVIPETGERI